ncbi:2-dehydro-3-deoxy-6-phosphogalactonate aldolase [Mesorhizobium sp. RP14(2022)]|uniref:2-dehydro-3-deoxy-6-phosphogalactonate aldolase n=2 Tax=Mesorhizobium liriopis TaxID=2953882 RepID=A0ABT1C3J3_9HYPH|nr:2-dehydro-3-deoxy-6-phosphogalactonate aldolase [Mesorhizobium liriopis]MCO6049407.1 2-dehydro-3-deoxy-6-phosphogalactonate aldolase [Mesorhizobium liriopis]
MSRPFPRLKRGLVAILRGLKPENAHAIAASLFEAGIEAIEVPLNSPEPFRSIETIVKALPSSALVGAGTVLTTENVDRLHDVGGQLLVSPNVDGGVLDRAGEHGMVTMPGVFTPTEAFQALRHGASALKFFPASVLGANGIAAIRAVLPKDAVIGAVGGVSEKDFGDYGKIGVETFGLGSSLFKPDWTAHEIGQRAKASVEAWDAVFGKSAA